MNMRTWWRNRYRGIDGFKVPAATTPPEWDKKIVERVAYHPAVANNKGNVCASIFLTAPLIDSLVEYGKDYMDWQYNPNEPNFLGELLGQKIYLSASSESYVRDSKNDTHLLFVQ